MKVWDLTDQFAPSEEFVLHCDVLNCMAQVSLVSGVPRSAHDWGRVTVYGEDNAAHDYDLCSEHNKAMNDVLTGH